MLETGKILQDRYRVEKQIGQGGMGSVYLATDERFNSTVAIKETLFTDDTFRKAFSREARLLNSLKHSALPKVSDTFIDGNGQYIVMEYIAGDDLFEMLEKSEEAFPLKDVLIWAEQLLDALEYLHGQENPVIHRDIKPQNLKLTSSGQIILLDFGLAKGNPTDANHHTAANSVFGYSRNYASLEQIQGTGTDPRSDIYSLAATLYHLLTGKTPADALTRVMMVLNEEKDPLQSANLIHEQVSEELAAHLDEAMSLNANLRPQSASEMRELLSGKRKRIVSTKPNTVPNKAAGTNLYTQNTKVFAEGEKPVNDSKQTDIKTEVLPNAVLASDSIKTKLKKPETLTNKKADTLNPTPVTQSSPSRNRLFAAVGAGLLLLVGTVASMVYFTSPVANLKSNEVKNDIGIANVSENSEVAEDSNLNTNSINANSELNTPDILAENETLPETENTIDSKETQNQKSADKPVNVAKGTNEKTKVKTTTETVIINDKKVHTGDVNISEGRVETKALVIDDKGILDKKTGKRVILSNLPKELSDAEKNKIAEEVKKARLSQDSVKKAIERAKKQREKEIEREKRNRLRELERERRLRDRENRRKFPPRPPRPRPRPPRY